MKNKKKDKNNVLLIVGILLIIGFISAGYAFLQASLVINGTANIGGSTWNIHFVNVQATADSNVTPTTTPVAVDQSTYELSFAVDLVKPGDMYQFTADIKNSGTIDAKIGSVELTNIPSSMPYILYTVTYPGGGTIQQNDVIAADSSRTVLVTVKFDDQTVSGEQLSGTPTPLSLTARFNFIQA